MILQIFLLVLLTIALVREIANFKDILPPYANNFLPNLFFEWFSTTAIMLIIWATIGYDRHLEQPWRDGALDNMLRLTPIALSLALSVNAYFVYNWFDHHFVAIPLVFAFTLIQYWFFSEFFKFLSRKEDERRFVNDISMEPVVVINDQIARSFAQKGLAIEKEKPIGWTHFCTTYRCVNTGDSPLPERTAMKVINPRYYMEQTFMSAMQNKIDNFLSLANFPMALRRPVPDNDLKHENIAHVLQQQFLATNGSVNHLIWFTEEAKYNLNTYLEEVEPNGITKQNVQKWFKQLAEAVQFISQQIDERTGLPRAHNNIKPENVLFYPIARSDNYNVKLSDSTVDMYFSRFGEVCTLNGRYMISPPEFVTGKRLKISQKKHLLYGFSPDRAKEYSSPDIFGLGSILVMMLKGPIERLIVRTDGVKVGGEDKIIYADFTWKPKCQLSVANMFASETDTKLVKLLRTMLQKEPNARPDIVTVVNSQWLNTPIEGSQ